jgi:hypothetical protein
MNTFHYISDARSLPLNRRIQPVAPVEEPKQTETEIWAEGFQVGLFWGVAIVSLMIAYLM